MNRNKRRKLLGLAAGTIAAGMLSVPARAGRLRATVAAPGTARPAPADVAAPLLDEAAAWIDELRTRGQTHLFYPVSRLQRKFLIGYGATCALADMLAQRGEWTIRFSGDGTRYARIHPRART
jgi:hypothetical protein